MLNGKYHQKVKNQIFFPAKNINFGFGPKIKKTKTIFLYKKMRAFRISCQVVNTSPDRAIKIAQRHFLGIFLAKKALFAAGGSSKPLFLSDF